MFSVVAHRRCLLEAEAKCADLSEQLSMRDAEISNLESQFESMTKKIAALEGSEENCAILKADAEAVKNLCNKLDFEKEKLTAELNECKEIRQKVVRIHITCKDGQDCIHV